MALQAFSTGFGEMETCLQDQGKHLGTWFSIEDDNAESNVLD